MSTDRGTEKEAMVCIYTHTHNGILLGHEKEWDHAICSTIGGPRDYHMKWISQKDADDYNTISLICEV